MYRQVTQAIPRPTNHGQIVARSNTTYHASYPLIAQSSTSTHQPSATRDLTRPWSILPDYGKDKQPVRYILVGSTFYFVAFPPSSTFNHILTFLISSLPLQHLNRFMVNLALFLSCTHVASHVRYIYHTPP